MMFAIALTALLCMLGPVADAPATAANPSAAPGSSQSPMLWLFGVFALVVFGSGALTRRLANAHRRAKTRA